MTDKASSRRVWFKRLRKFSLRSIMVLVSVLCVVLGTEVNGYRAQRRCVAALAERGFSGTSPRFTIPQIVKQRMPWITSFVSEHIQNRVTHVFLAEHHEEMVDRVLENTAILGSLAKATFCDLEWTESRLRDLSRQKRLKYISLNGRTTDGRVITAVSRIRSLERLSFNCTNVPRDAMLKLSRHGNLTRLALRGKLDETTMFDLKAGLPNACITLRPY